MKRLRRQEAGATNRELSRARRKPFRVTGVSFVTPSKADLQANIFRLFDLLDLGDDVRPYLKNQPPGVD
jgi:hypothetical protein